MKNDLLTATSSEWEAARQNRSARWLTFCGTLALIVAAAFLGPISGRSDAAAQQSGATAASAEETVAVFGMVKVNVGIVRQSPDLQGLPLDRVYLGESVRLLETDGQWLKIRLGDDSTGWVHQSLILPSGPPKPLPDDGGDRIVGVQVKRGLFRQSPSPTAEILGRVYRGDRLKVLERSGDWLQLELPDGRTAWAHQSLFDVTLAPPVVASAATGVAQPAAISAPTPQTEPAAAPTPEPLTTPEPQPTPEPQATPEPTAPALPSPTLPAAAATQPVPSPAATPPPEKSLAPIRELTVTVQTGRVRQQPSLSAPVLFNLYLGSKATLLATQGKWYHLRTSDGRTGWAHRMLFDPNRQIQTDALGGISAIRFVATSKGEEKVLILLDRLAPPKTNVKEGSQPQVICTFEPGRLGKDIEPVIEAKGEHIRRIRVVSGQAPSAALQVVIDLSGAKPSYQVKPVYFERQQLYTLTIASGS